MAEQDDTQKPPSTRKSFNTLRLERDVLDILAREGLISAQMRQDGLTLLHPAHAWGQWALMLLTTSGTILILAGIIFFFAFNWVALSPFQKLALLQGLVVASASAAALASSRLLPGQLLLLVSSVLVGVFLAVFGQIYQTEADPWQLFALWALLIFPWTILSAFSLQWLLWLVLLNLAIALWWDRLSVSVIWLAQEEGLVASLSLLNGSVLIVREALASKAQFVWLNTLWTRWLPAAVVLALLFAPFMTFVTVEANTSLEIAVGLLALLAYGSIFITYRFVWPDLPILAMWALCLCILILFSFVSLAAEWEWSDIAITLIASLLALSIFSFAAWYLRSLSAKSGGMQ